MNKLMAMSEADRILADMMKTGKLSMEEYTEALDCIQNRLDINQLDYLHALDGNWTPNAYKSEYYHEC